MDIDIRRLIGGVDIGWALRAPCRKLSDASDSNRVPCDHFAMFTRAEGRARNIELIRILERHAMAADTVDAFRSRHKRQNAQETVDCPTGCGGRLTLSIAAINGHCWGRCSTPGCLAWME